VAVHIAIKTNATTAKKRKRFLLLKSIDLAEAAGVVGGPWATSYVPERQTPQTRRSRWSVYHGRHAAYHRATGNTRVTDIVSHRQLSTVVTRGLPVSTRPGVVDSASTLGRRYRYRLLLCFCCRVAGLLWGRQFCFTAKICTTILPSRMTKVSAAKGPSSPDDQVRYTTSPWISWRPILKFSMNSGDIGR